MNTQKTRPCSMRYHAAADSDEKPIERLSFVADALFIPPDSRKFLLNAEKRLLNIVSISVRR